LEFGICLVIVSWLLVILSVSSWLLIICGSSLAEVKFTSDLTRLGVGARPLGMGKMFTGLSDDLSALYLNPGGLASQDTFQILSMSGQFVNLVNYYTLAASVPLGKGVVGVAYNGAGMGFSTPALNLVEIATGEYRIIPSTTETVSYNYGNSVFSFAYSQTLFRPDLSFGANLKMFMENISGSDTANAKGYDLDLGVLFKPHPSLTLGALGKNVLPASLGGKVVWSTNLEETLPMVLSLGGSLKWDAKRLGEITVGADYELKPTQANTLGLIHAGIEWWPIPLFAARAGIDQDVIGKDSGTALETTNNFTSGVSLKIADFRFDLAYHRYNDVTANDTYYFSLGYRASKLVPLTVLSPADKLITNEVTVMVRGKVEHPKIKSIKINDQIVAVKKGSFEAEVSLMLGKNTIWVSGLDEKGKAIKSVKLRVLRLKKFADVPSDYWAREAIELLGTLNIMPGFSNDTFRPEEKITRADYLINLLNVGKTPPATELKPFPFKDIKLTDKFAPYAKAGYDEKLILGYPDKTFRPLKLVNRLEGTILAVRFSKFSLAEVRERPYEDISARHWAIKEITTAKEKSMLKFVLENFYPKKDLTRAELAVMLSKTPKVAAQIEELLNFEIGY